MHFSSPWLLHTMGWPHYLFRLRWTFKDHNVHCFYLFCILDLKKKNSKNVSDEDWRVFMELYLIIWGGQSYLAVSIQLPKFHVIDERNVILRMPIKTVIEGIKWHAINHSIDWLDNLNIHCKNCIKIWFRGKNLKISIQQSLK